MLLEPPASKAFSADESSVWESGSLPRGCNLRGYDLTTRVRKMNKHNSDTFINKIVLVKYFCCSLCLFVFYLFVFNFNFIFFNRTIWEGKTFCNLICSRLVDMGSFE